jgi:hypothetical protein
MNKKGGGYIHKTEIADPYNLHQLYDTSNVT